MQRAALAAAGSVLALGCADVDVTGTLSAGTRYPALAPLLAAAP